MPPLESIGGCRSCTASGTCDKSVRRIQWWREADQHLYMPPAHPSNSTLFCQDGKHGKVLTCLQG